MVPIRIEIEREGNTPLVMRYRAHERNLAMDAWDNALDACLPGQRIRLINEVNDRVVSEYTNNKQSEEDIL
jgi:hypothetical protein